MPFDAGTAKGSLDLDVSGFTNALTSAQKGIGKFTERLGSLANKAAIGAIASAAAGIVALTAALAVGSRGAAEGEKALAGFANVLKAQGVPNFKAVTAEVDAFATSIQRLTGETAESVIGIAQQLSNLGVAAKSLKPASQIVLDFAAAFGISATAAARAFGQSLQGNAGRLARFLPQIRELTKAQLEAGGAFRIAAEAARGQAEALGNTFTGRIARLSESFEDFLETFGKAFNEAFGPLATEIQEVFDLVTDRLSQGVGFDLLKQGAQEAADVFRTAFNAALQSGPVILEVFLGVTTAINVALTAMARLAQVLAIAAGAFDFADRIGALADQMAKANEAGIALTKKLGDFGTKVNEAVDDTKTLKQNVVAVANAFGLASTGAGKTAEQTRKAAAASEVAVTKARSVVDIWKKVNEAAETTEGSVKGVTSATTEAASAADDLEDSWEGVAASASAAADASDLAARFAASGADAFGRRSGGSTALDFSDPFAAASQAQNAFAQLGRAGLSAFAGGSLINSARQFATGVLNQAQASVDRAVAEFISQILVQLDQSGVFDPTQRSRIVSERLAEARRLGVIPSANALQPFGATSTGIR